MASHKHGHPAGGSPSDLEFAVGSPRAALAPGREPEPEGTLRTGPGPGPLQVEDDRVTRIRAVRNPAKLRPWTAG
ncbi:hypothetical protein [Streptomyces canus]|uniref:hypothetical protein n=1 Tax=Streptomyces canus TaxID=58343 RepID=UPI0032441FFA